MRSAGEFPWDTCNPWVKAAGPYMRDVDFIVIVPLQSFPPFAPNSREGRLEWDYPLTGICSVLVLPGAGGVVAVRTPQVYPAGPVPPGLMDSPFQVGTNPTYPYWPPNHAGFDGQCQRAGIKANRIRQNYVPVAPPPGVPGFTGFNLLDLREIAKSFGEPSIYTIRP
jgi:hypothetical protein